MPPPPEPWMFASELVYTIVVMFLCAAIYYKTRDIYEISRHEGIKHFRNAFLFFGLAYLTRFLLHFLMITRLAMEIDFGHRLVHFSFLALTGYFSSMAIFQIIYCTVWKRISANSFIFIANTIAILFSVISIITRSPQILTALQTLLLILGAILIYVGRKGPAHSRGLYMLTMVLWLLNLYLLSPRWLVPPGAKIFLQIGSIIVFGVIYHKVTKWAR
jgi:hypothetical protein